MRAYILTAAAVAAGLTATGGRAAAQYHYGYGSPYYGYTSGHYTPYGYAGGSYTPYGSPAVGGWGQGYAPGGYGSGYQPTYGYGNQYNNGYNNSYSSSYNNGSVYGGYPAAAPTQPVDPATAGVIQSLYQQYLGREPDAQGFQFWSSRLAALGGDTALLTHQFAAAAQNERAASSPVYTQPYTAPFRRYYRFR